MWAESDMNFCHVFAYQTNLTLNITNAFNVVSLYERDTYDQVHFSIQ